MTTIEELEKEIKIIRKQTEANTVKYNTIIFMLDKLCKHFKLELRR